MRLIETFPIALPGRPLTGRSYQTDSRRTGRRITVTDESGAVIFDTDDCYDLGNATNRLDLWLTEQPECTAAAGAKVVADAFVTGMAKA